jgi:hypothetical protein
MDQLARHVPDAVRVVCCVDRSDPVEATAVGAHLTVNAADLGIPRFKQLAFALPATGLCCALKPAAVLHALQETGADSAVYLDNDIAVYRDPVEMRATLEDHSMVLTPHITSPLPSGAMPDLVAVQQYGVWNAGMFGARADAEARTFLEWWSGFMADPRRLSGHHGWDQQWLEFAPAMVEDVKILRDPTYNVAVWNLPSRQLARNESGWTVDGRPLTTFHFSWFDEKNPHAWLRGGSSCNLPITKELVALGEEYAALLKAGETRPKPPTQYGFACYRDGKEITVRQRELLASRLWDFLGADDDSFDPVWTHSSIPGGGPLSQWRDEQTSPSIGDRLKKSVRSLLGR